MSATLLALGVSHKTAHVALRERLALPEGRASGFLNELVAHPEIREAVTISTCNRTELYMVVGDTVEAESAALGALARQAEMRPTELFGRLYSLRDADAVRHLFEVAGGLDSMIVGEAEVQGQVKRAYELALVEGVTGPISNRLFRDALAAGKRVRTETAIGRSHVSVSSVAVDLAQGTLGELTSRRVLIVGAGENGELTAQALHRRGAHTVFVANRRYDRAIGLAQRFGGTAVRFDDLPAQLAEADIVVSCTSSPHQIVGRDELALVVEQRDARPLLVIDIAVPRDIDPSVRDLPGITLYDMDDLQREVSRNVSGREAEATRARTLIEDETDRFVQWLGGLDVVPTIAALHERADAIVEQVLRENERRWQSLSEEDRARVEMMARAIASRMLHEPTLQLKRSAGEESYVYLQALRELFGIEAGGGAADEAPAADVTSLDSRRRRQSR
ncbi:MAG: glutamyl-tRNA reductase [Thermoleophilaceae bacterium]|jgi:glutamyl-tRNA reductase|nr:glutamyl-tRNA reductase [Thermoleophilaceae bacterium]MEA2387699.1 glutamyl-tRNA reductase [Thermoleophilaceae bacterium]